MSILNTSLLKTLFFPVSLSFLVLVCNGILFPPKKGAAQTVLCMKLLDGVIILIWNP